MDRFHLVLTIMVYNKITSFENGEYDRVPVCFYFFSPKITF